MRGPASRSTTALMPIHAAVGAVAEWAVVVYRVVVQLGQAACLSDRLRWYGRGGLTARRAEAIATATRLGGDRLRAPVGEADSGAGRPRRHRPQWFLNAAVAPRPAPWPPSTASPRFPSGSRTKRQTRRSPLRRGAGGLRGSRRKPAGFARCSERGVPARSRRSAWCRLSTREEHTTEIAFKLLRDLPESVQFQVDKSEQL